MSLRLLQIVVPKDKHERLLELLDDASSPERWSTDLSEEKILTSVLMRMQLVEHFSDTLRDEFNSCDCFRLILLPVEATSPKLPELEEEDDPDLQEDKSWSPRFGRVSREELIEDIEGSARTTPVFLIMVALATIVACVGLLKNSPAIIIGAMVIAPLLGPNMALALGTTLGDLKMGKRAVISNTAGISLAVALAVVFGIFFIPDELNNEVSTRTAVDLGDILLALASGAAGAIAFTSGASAIVVGVMVAVALLPPTAVFGMLMGAGNWYGAGEAATLAATNIVCINLSATGVFLLQGVRPSSWWEKDRARSATFRALLMWAFFLAALIALIIFAWKD